MEHQFSRQEFFDLMWSKPIKDIAPEFGMSDVGLAKICRSHALPLPGRGYWAKLKAGKKVMELPLPPRGLGEAETIHVGQSDWRRSKGEDARLMAEEIPPPPEFPETVEALTERVTKLVGKVAYLRDLNRTDGAVTRLLEGDVKRVEKRNASSYPSFLDEPYFVSPYERRRLKLLNSIFLALAKLQMQSMAEGKHPSEFTVRVGNTHVRFRLDDPKAKRETWRPASDSRRPTTDPLQLSISWYREKEEGLRLVWVDSRDTPLEESLQEIVIGLIVAGEMQVRAAELQKHTWRVEQKAELIAAARKREEEARRKERARLQRLEKARVEHLLEDAMSLRLANDLRTYIQAVQEVNKASDVPVSEEEMAEWVAWASAQVERIHPIQRRSFLQLVEDPGEVPRESGSQPRTSTRPDDIGTTPAWHPNRWYTQLHR
jgi:hypothetical protein